MAKVYPLHTDPGREPVLLANIATNPDNVREAAERRLHAAKALLFTLSAAEIETPTGADVQSVSQAAWMLLQDGCDLLDAAEEARSCWPPASREGGRHE